MKESFMLNINMFIICIFISNLHCCCSACDASMTLKWVTDFMHRCKQKSSTHLMEAGNIEIPWKVFVHTSKVHSDWLSSYTKSTLFILKIFKTYKMKISLKKTQTIIVINQDLIYASVIVHPGIVSMEINIKQYFPSIVYIIIRL